MLDIFSDFSGLRLNRAKSSFIGFGLPSEELAGCAQILATPIGALPIRYLGVPLVDRRLRIREWQPVLEKVETPLGGWRARFLSRGGGGGGALYCSRRYYQQFRPISWPYSGCPRGSSPPGVGYAGFLMARLSSRRVSRGGACCMRDRVPAGFPRRIGGPAFSASQHDPLDQVVVQLMHPSRDLIAAVLRDGYGASLDWQMWQTPQRGDAAFMSSLRPIFKAVQPFFRPKQGTRESFRFWADEWSGNGSLGQSFPRLFALTSDPEGSVRQAWQNAWAPALPTALSDQRVLDFMRLQELLANQRPSTGPDAWIWSGQNFTVRAVYLRLRERADSEDPLFLRLWRRVWKSRIPLKIRIFVWLLLRQRLMTRSFQQCMALDSSGDCALCGATMEDCEHLFVLCPISQAVWWSVSVARPKLTSLEDFW